MEVPAQTAITTFFVSHSSPTENQTSSKSTFKGKRKMKKKDRSKIAHEAPDLDIVSGFAFLSFSNIADLEYHIEQTEAKSCSLSINVGAKRKIRPKKEEKDEIVDIARSSSKRIRVPSQKILESYATKDVPITELVGPSTKHPGKLKQSPQEKEPNSYLYHTKGHMSEPFNSSFLTYNNTNDASSDISLECSETIDVCGFDDDEYKPIHANSAVTEKVVKKPKKKKRNTEINDTSCQTMFRIKKKKKKHLSTDLSIKPEATCETVKLCDSESITTTSQDSTMLELPDSDIIVQNIDKPNVYVIKEESFESAKDRYKQMQATKFFDSKQNRPKPSNKVEKIDYCARSGGLELVERHHERQARKLKEQCDLDSLDEFQVESDSQDNCNASISSDNSSSSNEFSFDAPSTDQEGLLCNRNRIFAGSSSIFLSAEESHDDSDIDIDDGIDDPIPSDVNIVKGLPGNYLFGHFSTYPDKSTDGTIDVSLQIYESDIQLYMNYASDFNGRIIKIITPDNEENKNSCLPNLKSQSGVPKILQPREYVKAIRSATERNRRHNLGDLFNHLKKEIFGDVTEYYFSKQAILTKALEVISSSDQEYYELSKERAKLSARNQLLRKSLNGLLFGKTTECEQKVDVDKVTDCLKTMGIEIKIPESKQGNKSESDKSKESSETPKSNVSKKGRPPVPGKLFKKIEIISEPSKKDNKAEICESQIKDYAKAHLKPVAIPLKDITQTTTTKAMPSPNAALIDANMKTFVAIAPKEPQSSVKEEKASIQECKESPTAFAPVEKIVCNISRYRLETTGEKSGMTLITKQAEPFKSIESKNVVHIKISNDVMKQISNVNNNSAQATVSNPTTKGKLVELSQLSSTSFANQSSFSTQTDFETLPPCTDYNSNSIKLSQAPTLPSSSTTFELGSDKTFQKIPESSFAVTASTTMPVSTNKPLVLKASDSLKKLVSILRERALTHTSQEQTVPHDVSSVQSSANIQCSSLSTITKNLPQITAQASSNNSATCSVSNPMPPSEVVKGVVTMAAAAQVSKVNTTLASITNSGHTDVSTMATPVNVTMATPNPMASSSGHITMSIPAHITTAASVAMATVAAPAPKSVAMTTTAQFPITAQIHTSVQPSQNPVTMTTGKQQPVVSNVMKQLPQQQQKYISVLPQSSIAPVLKGANVTPNNPIRIVFKPVGKSGNTPADQLQGAVQSPRVLQLPPGTTLSSNVLQGSNFRLLLQKNNPVLQQLANSTSQSQNNIPQKLAPKTPQVVYSKPLVKIQPQLQPRPFLSPTILQQSQTSVPGSSHGNGNIPVQPLLTSTTKVVCATTSSPVLPSTFTNQPVLINTGSLTGSRINQPVFSPISCTASPLMPQQTKPVNIQKPASTSINTKSLFTGMEQVVANIPKISTVPIAAVPQQVAAIPQHTMPLKRKFRDLLPAGPKKPTVDLPRLVGVYSEVTTAGSNNPPQVINTSSVLVPSTLFSSSNQGSMNTVEVNQGNMVLMSDEIRTSFASNSIASQPSVPYPSMCNTVTFQPSEPQRDKTCCVVERTVDNSNVVTADKLSVWNIDSSIPDIKSELKDDKSLTD